MSVCMHALDFNTCLQHSFGIVSLGCILYLYPKQILHECI